MAHKHKRGVSDSAVPPSPKRTRTNQMDFEISHKLDFSPSCPGVVKKRDDLPLSKLPSAAEVFSAFAKARADKALSDEAAFLDLISTYDIPLSLLSTVFTQKLPCSFSNVKYDQIAPFVHLSAELAGSDIQRVEVCRSRIPDAMFREIVTDVDESLTQYGPLEDHDNEETRSRFFAALFNKIVCLFNSAVINKPEGILDSEVTKRGRIEHHFLALKSVSIVFIEVKRELATGKHRMDMTAQVLAGCSACDYANAKVGLWVPILAVLCDGYGFEFFVYDSADKSVYSSGITAGIYPQMHDAEDYMIASIKRITEYLFDWFLIAYINGIRAFGDRSSKRSQIKKRLSTEKWQNSLALAEKAHWMLREGAVAATPEQKKFGDAEQMAEIGVELLKQSVAELPQGVANPGNLQSRWRDNKCLEEAMPHAFYPF
ncbi:hypothetical protein AJ78_08130 [Emergomyces pasteurianus Ep9510]|uniref:Uncharacterized protein n=1 Tax=Emergomyces pasteurianus Ep9510 TaxID=1447872 RepID=A0A1J9Q510_9EURO|nr:hypothetical protein AJ78_08130 [Emergomyces pasteurianus Ep9510]